MNSTYTGTIVDLHRSEQELGLSWKLVDPSYMPPGTEEIQRPIWGQHFFGDLQIFFGYVNSENPYSSDLSLPSQIPPLGLSIYKLIFLLGNFGLLISFVLLYVLPFLSVILWSEQPMSTRLMIFLNSAILPVWAIVALDRGNALPIAAALLSIGYWFVCRNRPTLLPAVTLIVFAISLKPQLGVFLAFLFLAKQVRLVISVVVTFFISNSLMFFVYSSDLISNWESLLKSLSSYQSPSVVIGFVRENVMSLYGLLQTFRPLAIETGSNWVSKLLDFHHLALTLLVVLLIAISVITVLNRVPRWIQLVLWLSVSQLGVAATGTYGGAWQVFALSIVGHRRLQDENSSISPSVIAVLAAIAMSSIPFTIHRIMSPLTWIIALLVTLFESILLSLKAKKSDPILKSA
jgi:hypothetical protein